LRTSSKAHNLRLCQVRVFSLVVDDSCCLCSDVLSARDASLECIGWRGCPARVAHGACFPHDQGRGDPRLMFAMRMERSMKSIRTLFAVAALGAVTTAVAASGAVDGFPPKLEPADLVLRDATIVTLDPLQPEAQALAVRDGRIQAVG